MTRPLLSRLTSVLQRPLRSQPLFFGCLYAFGAICIVFEVWNSSRLLSLFELFFDLYMVCSLLMLLPAPIRHWTRVLLAGSLYLIGLADMFCYVRLHTPLTTSLLQVAMQTNWQESREALGVYRDASLLASPFGLLCLVVIIHILLSSRWGSSLLRRCNILTGRTSHTEPPRQRSQHAVASWRWLQCMAASWRWFWRAAASMQWLRSAAAACFPFALALCTVISIPNKEHLLYTQVLQLPIEDVEKYEHFETKTRLYLPVYRLADAIRQYRESRDKMRVLPWVAAATAADSCSFRSPTIVLIIGESYNRHHSQLYGYPKATTPRQLQRREQGELYVFSDVVSAWNLTFLSFQDMLSLRTQTDSGKWFEYPLFTTMFRQAGYRVTFLSNQYVTSLDGRFSDFMEDVFMNDPRMSQYQFDARNSSTHAYDGDLLDDYDELCTGQTPPQLVVFHFLGLHADFAERFPAGKTCFSPSHYERPDLSNEERQTLADYDNAMRYNDQVVDDIVCRFQNQEAIVIFLADHGERVFDFGTRGFGRTFLLDRQNVAQLYDVPFWVWCSTSYRERHPDICDQLAAAVDRKWTTAHLGQLMLYLGGIGSQYYKPWACPLTPAFKESRRIINGNTDYDKLMLGGATP